MMKSALLFYRKLVSELQEMGFTINPYDPCVANKTVNGTQMTIRWHVDDLMLSHVSQDEIMRVVQGIKYIYGENLTKTVGTMHDYLGMTFDYSFAKEVRVNMCDYLRNVIKEFPEEITGTCATPASDHLFKVREDGRKLSEELADAFHHTVYQLLFAANRARGCTGDFSKKKIFSNTFFSQCKLVDMVCPMKSHQGRFQKKSFSCILCAFPSVFFLFCWEKCVFGWFSCCFHCFSATCVALRPPLFNRLFRAPIMYIYFYIVYFIK